MKKKYDLFEEIDTNIPPFCGKVKAVKENRASDSSPFSLGTLRSMNNTVDH